MKIFKSKILISTIALLSTFIFKVQTASAQGLCNIFPCNEASPCLGADCGGDSLSVVGSILQLVLSLVFVGIIIYGIWLIIQAALKIVRSEGDESKIQEGTKLIKGAYIGLALIFVGLIGLVIVFVIFNATDIFRVSPDGNPPGLIGA